jgi:uncharacterized membrane protein
MENKIRSLSKSISWRIIALLNGWMVTYLFTGDLKNSFFISFVANISGFILYYIHERVWNKMKWGKK